MNNESNKSSRKKFNPAAKSNNHKIIVKAVAFLLLTIFIGINLPGLQVSATGTITGIVFQDFNGNGDYDTNGGTATTVTAIDAGVAGAVVTAYDSTGTLQGTATSAADGTYSLSAAGTGPYRLEFAPPSGFQPSARNTNSLIGGSATNSGSSVQFVADGNTGNVNFAVNRPQDYCQNNPLVCVSEDVRGNVDGGSLRTFPYDYSTQLDGNINVATTAAPTRGTNELAPTDIAQNNSIGTIHGVAWNRATRRLYASAVVKRAAKLGALSGESTGAIYVKSNPAAATPAATVYVDLNAVFTGTPAGANPHPVATTDYTDDIATAASVGKVGLGDLEISQDGSTLYSVNLNDRQLYVIPTSGTLNSTTITRFAIPTANLTTAGGTCPTADVRPFGLGRDGSGQIYVGAVCSAESVAGTAAVRQSYLHAFVWRFSGGTFTLAANTTLNYTRTSAGQNQPWLVGDNTNSPELILTDIEFDRGSMIVGFRDKNGDENYNGNSDRGYGEILRAASSNGTTWTFESNGTAGGITTAGANTAGLGGGEYYIDLNGDNRSEGVQGGLLQIPGFNHTMTTAYDATAYDSAGNRINNFYSGGVQRYSNTTGQMLGAYDVYLNAESNTFRKANGMGDIEALCDSAPIEIGNRVWRDANNNGVQDPQESRAGTGYVSLAGITVRLYNSANVLVGTAVTDQDGEYYFTSGTAADPDLTDNIGIVNGGVLPNTTYQIRFDNAADFTTGGVLAGLVPTRANATQQAGIDDASDSDAFRVTNPVNSPAAGNFAVITYTTGAAGSNDHTLDAGFAAPVSIGSTIFNDPNNNGVFDVTETGIGNVAVELLYDADGDGAITGTELTTPLATATTSSVAGSVGNYFFGGLTPGNYQVRIPTAPAAATLSSTVTNTTDSRIDNDDNGTQTGGAGGSTISPIINLTPGAEPLNAVETGQGGTQDDAAGDANGDMTVDFGFLAPASIGDTVFSDVNRNGVQDAGEPGINGVTVTLYDNLGNVAATTTTATVGPNAGQYSFTGLAPGTYSVGFTLPTGFGYAFTLADQGGNDAVDSDANQTTGRTGNYTLIAGQNNTTVDAGVVQTLSLGNQVFNDADNNGVRNGAEVGISGLTVNLYLDANNDNIPDGAAIATTTTIANGLYLFSGLAPGNYIVGVVTPTNFVRSSINGGDPDNNIDNDNNGISTVGNETRSNAITLALTTEPINENPSNDTNTPDNSSNLTLDFGFTPNYSLGNRVWFDTNNDGMINSGEVGINGISVSIFASGNLTTALQTITTDSLGYYRFDNLYAGTYVVRVNPSNFVNGAALAGYQNTAGNTAADLDSTATAGQNGEDGINPTGAANTIQTNGISSNVITLGALAEPTGETDVQAAGQGTADNQANMTIDFGFYRMSLAGTVWNDNGAGANTNNGILNAGEPGITGVRVQLYDSANTEINVGADDILGTSDDAAGGIVTNSSGNYNFQGLPPGTYRVVVTLTNSTSSTLTSINPDDNIDNNDDGTPQNAGVFSGRVTSGLVTLTPGNAGLLSNNTITNASGSTTNPTVDFGFILSPTVVKLDKFDVFSDGSSVELKWSTGSEASNLGFNVYREIGGKRRLLNAAPIAGSALRSSADLTASGGEYSWTDKEFNPNAVYYLEDLDLDGSASLHGAVAPQFAEKLGNQPNARTFSDLANAGNSTGLKETVADHQKTITLTDQEAAAAMARQQQIAALGGAKITVNHDGWYRVSAQQLQAAGFDTNSNPQVWQLYTDGSEVSFKLNSDNSIEFFGRGLDTAMTDRQVYYLIKGQTNGLRVNAFDGGAASENADADSFGVTVSRQDRSIYVSALLNGDEDNWFGAVVSRSGQTEQTLNAVNVNERGRAHLSVKLQGVVDTAHSVIVRVNDTELGTAEFSGYENKQFEFDVPSSTVREGVNRVYLQSNGAGNDVNLVDTIRLSYQRGYTATDNRLRFSVPANQSVRVNGFTDENISVYELRSGAARMQVVGASENSEGNYGFSLSASNADREMIAVVNASVESAAVEANTPSTWNKAANQADFVIITANELRESADTLAAMRESQGLATKVVLVDDLFDEFSFGRRDPNAVKQFLKTATTKWRTKPNYALLFGDSSYDTRNNLGLTTTRDLVPTKLVDTTYLETASDAWLADFDNDGAEDIALGRLPVGNASEAAAVVEKLSRFDGQGDHREKSDVLVADNGFEDYSAALQTLLPGDVNSFRIDRSAATDAETHQQIVEQLNNNPLLVTYTGHGSQTVWASSGIFSNGDVNGLTNNDLSFYLLMNCLNGYTHQPTGDSLAEILVKAPNGAIAIWASSGITESGNQAAMGQAFTNYVFNKRFGKAVRIGDVVKAAKRAAGDTDVRRTWQLFGDPTIFVK